MKTYLLIVLIILGGLCLAMSGKPNYEKELIGNIENEGRLYRAYNDLFTMNNKPYFKRGVSRNIK